MINNSKKNIIYLFGKNGSGKSTYIKNWINENYKVLKISYLSQDSINSLSNLLITVDEFFISNSYFVNNNTQKINELISYFEVDFLRPLITKNLSGGEKQIISLIYQLSKDSDYYILDEPFNNLDTSKIELVNNYIKNSSHKYVIVSHHLDSIIKNSELYKFNNFNWEKKDFKDIHGHY